jgi:hypothetical protein
MTFLFSKAGTYLVNYPEDPPGLARWKWADDKETLFMYSWDNWEEYGTARKLELTRDYLKFNDSTYSRDEKDSIIIELVPERQ